MSGTVWRSRRSRSAPPAARAARGRRTRARGRSPPPRPPPRRAAGRRQSREVRIPGPARLRMLGSAGAHRGPLSRDQRGLRSLRELLHQGHAPRRRPRRSGSATRCTSARARSSTARSGSRSSTPTPRVRGRRRSPCRPPRSRRRGRATSRSAAPCSSPARARGEIATPELEASWDLRFEPGRRAFRHLPYGVSLRRAAAEDEVPLPLSRRPLHGRASRSRASGSSSRPGRG